MPFHKNEPHGLKMQFKTFKAFFAIHLPSMLVFPLRVMLRMVVRFGVRMVVRLVVRLVVRMG